MEDNSRIDDFYNDLVQSGFTFGGKTDRASYDAMMADDARSKKLYGILTDRGWDLDDYDTWRNGFSSQSQPNSAIMAPQGGGENGNEFTAEQLDGFKDPYQTAHTPQQVQQMMDTSRMDPKYQLNEDGSVKPWNMLETERTLDEQGNTVNKPKLVKGTDGTDVYRNAMTGEEYNPLSAEGMEMAGQNTNIVTTDLKKANREQVANLSADIDNAFAEYQKKRPTAISYGTYYGGAAGVTNTQDKEFQTLTAAKQSVYDAQKMIEAADANAKNGTIGEWLNSSFAGGAVRGFGEKLFDVRTWDMGLSNAVNNKTLYEALQKADSGQELTKSEQMLLDAKSVEMATNAYFGSYLGRGYQAGAMTAEALPFMLEMAINPASTAGNTAQSMLARYAMKRLGKKASLEALEKGAKGAFGQAFKEVGAKETAKILGGRLAGDLAGSAAMAATTGVVSVTADAFDRMNNGEEDWGTAIAKAYGSRVIENYSEMVGEYFAPVLGVAGKGLSKGMNKIGLGAVNDFIEQVGASDLAKMVTDFEKNAKWSGLFSEYAEEVTGNIMNALTVGDMTLDTAEGTGVFNLDQNIDTFLGTALMGGALSGIKTLGYRTPKYRARKAMTGADDTAAALFADPAEWGNIKNAIAFGTDEDAKEMLADVLGSDAFSAEQKAAVMNYASKAEAYKGVMMAEQKRRGENSGSAEVDVETSYDNGQSLETPQEKNDARNMYDMQRERLAGIVDEDFLQQFDEDPLEALNDVMTRDDFTEEERQAALDYVNAKATYDGMIDKVRDDIDSQVAASDASINSRTNRAGANAGMIVPATMKMGDRHVYVIDGDIQMMDDGSMVDVSKSSESILVRDAETGKLEFVSPHDVLNLGQAVSAEQEKATAREAIMQQVAQEQSAIIEGVLPFNAGDVYELADENGQTVQVTVVQDNGDGNVTVTMNGQNVPMPKDHVQAMSDAANMKRLADYQQQKNGGTDNAPTNSADQNNAGSQQRGYALNDEVVLRDDDGNGVRGTIVSEPDADGLYEVETAMPINGKRVNQWSADEIGAMLMEHNGEAVSQREPTVNAEPEANATGTVADEQQPSTAAGTVAEPMPMIGEGDDAEPNFLATTPERGLSFLFGESGWEERDADYFIDSNAKASAKEVEKIEGKRPKPSNFAKFNKDMAAWNASKQEAEAKAKYWKQMKELRDAELAKQKAERDAVEKARQEAATDQAIAEEAAYAAEQAQKAAEQAQLGSNNVAPAIRDKWNNAQKTVGSADEIVLANGEKITGHYVLVESGAASPSHNANNGFTKTEGFPVDENGNSVNDRDYERDQDAQRITRDIASRYDSRALQTPVVVSQDGVVLSGNGRTMAGEIAAADGTDGAYNQYVKDRAAKYGFTTEQVEKMQHPRVVFVPDASLPYTAETFAKFNQQEMKGQNKTEQAVKLGKVVDDATFNRIVNIIDRFDTLGEFYADPKASREAISELQSAGAISQAQLAEMLDGDGISAIGRDLLENMLVGKAFENNPDAVREISSLKSMRQSVIKALGEILDNVKLGEDYSLEEELAGAIDLVYKARKEGGYKEGERVSGFARQMNLGFFGEDMTVADMTNVTMLEIADVLNSGFETRLKVYMQNYNTHAQESAAGQLDLFSGEVMSKEDILNDVNNLFNNGTEQETADTRAEGVAEDGAVNNGGAESESGLVGDYSLSDQTAANGEHFIQDADGNIDLVDIPQEVFDEIGYRKAPLRLTPSMLDHFISSHGDETKTTDRNMAIKFILDVMNNFDHVRLGYDGALIFSVENGRKTGKRAISILISQATGEFYGIVSSGYEGVSRLQKRPLLWDGSAVITPTTDAASANVSTLDAQNSGEQSGSASNQSEGLVSAGKGSNNSATEQAEVDENNGFSANEAETESADGNSSPVAEAIAAAEAETDTNPSEAQKEAGNYKKGHVKVDGYDITIENPKGSVRSGKDADGKEWSVTMNNTYGYIRGTEGVDGDHIDVFLSDNPEQGNVYVVDQVDADGNFDEHKVMYGFGSAEEAREAYLANYSEGWTGLGTITEVSKEEFKKWIESSHRKTKPFSEYKSVKKEGAQGEAQAEPTPQEARDWLNAKYDGQAMPTDGSSHAVGWIDNLSDEDALVMYRAETLGSDPTKTEDDAFEVFQYFDDLSEGVTPSESAIPILEKYGKKFEDMDDTAYRKGESLKDYMQRNGDYIGTKRDYMVAKYGAEKVDSAVELFAEYNDGKAADIAQKLYDLGIKDKEEAMAIYDLAFDKKYVHTPNTLPFIDAFFDLAHSKNKKQQPSTAAVQTNASETANENASKTQPSTDVEKKPRTRKPSDAKPDEKIEDVGEKIGGARKDATLNYAKKIDLEATVPSKIFPKPNFASMEKAGVPHETLVRLKAYYTAFSIINKSKRKRNENQRILSARFYASVARDMLLRDVDVFNESADGIVLTDYGKQHLELLVACVEALDKKGMQDFFDLDISDVNITIGEFKENENGAYQTKDGKRWVGSYSYGRTNNMAAVRYKLFALDDIEGLAEEYCKQVEEAHSKNVQNEIKIHVYRMSSGKCYISAKVKGIADEIKLKDDFSSSKEAFDYIRENGDAIRTEARAKADEMKQSKKNGGGTRKPTNDDIERMLRNIVQGTRIGKDYRNGKDVSAEDFMKEFGFRGVEFGNWATQKERQDHLNACYDALMDLADLIGISPKAISLGGKLAMAFGSRGHSSALAHYEPAKHVINLTKEHGAGCVAHEWFHAIDNYFGGGVFGLRMKSAVEGKSRDNLRSEMQKIFAEIGRALNGSDMKVRSKKLGNGDYWASTLEMAARAFESYVNERLMARGQMNQYLSAHVPGEAVEYDVLAKYDPYPTAEESKKFGEIFDRLFDTVQEEVGDDGSVNLFQIADVEPGTENVTEAQQLATEAIITALGENAGLDVVMETREEGQRVAAEQNADTKMMALSNNDQEFDSMKKMAHDEKGHVMPGLAEKTVTVVPLNEHGFGETFGEAVKNAKEWAKSNLAGKEYDFPEGGKYVISNKAIGKYMSSSAFSKSDNNNVHLAALRMLPEIIGNSMDAEIHEDYKKDEDGKRNVNNGVENENKLVHRLYGAVTLGDKTYRVKTTMYEYRDGELKNNTPHSYEITEIELLDSPVLPAEAVKNTIGISNNSISGANLLKNVEKSYDNGVKILENQQNAADNKEELKSSDGTVYGWSEGNRIHLTPEGINPNTPIHEYTHLWARAVMQKNPKLWNRINELLQGTPIWDEVVNDPAYQGLTTDDAIASEALSRLSGRKNAGKMEKMAQDLLNEAKGNGVFAEANAHTLILKMKQALKDFWKWVGTNLFDMTEVKNIDEVTDRVLYDLLNKTDLSLSEDGDVATEFQVVTDEQVNTDIRFRERTEFDDGEVIDIVGNRGSQDFSLADSTIPSYKTKEELLHAFQEKHPAYAAVLTADGNGIEVTAWKNVLDKNIRKPRRRNGEHTKAEKQRAAYVERKTQIAIANVNEKAQKLGLNVEVITDTESLPKNMADKKGWYNKVTGKITIVLPNHSNGQDVMRTLMHEGVAHHGLRQMFGEDFNTFLDNVYANASEEVRKRIAEMASRKGWDFHVATEEYLAALAEDIDFERKVDQNWWKKVRNLFVDMLRKAGIVLDTELTDNDLRYIVWKSYERMAYAGEYGAIRDARTVMMDQQLGTGNFGTRAVADGSEQQPSMAADSSELLYRDGDRMDQRDHATIRDSYEREIKTATYQMREAVQDSMLSLRRMMEEIEKATGNKIADYENAYMAENALSSKNLDEQRMYKKMLFEPMLDEVYRLAKEEDANGDKPGRDGVTRYMMAKHGLERQKLMEARAYQAGERSDRDFAGLTGLFETDDLADAIQQAEQLVADFESSHKVDDLWKKVNACTKSTLEKSYKCGIISKEGYERISKMYDFYIPLRGFKEDTSDKIYAYLNHETGSFQSPVRGAFGRETVASDIFANILNMADSAIAQGNKNLVKQKFLKMVMNHPTDLASVNKMWLKKNDITGEWEAVTAQLDPNDSAEQVFQKTEAFEENMAQLAESDPDHYKRGKDLKDIPYRVLGNNLSEHQVYVKMGGQDYIITINGNPRVAQAVNGLSNPDSNSKILGGKLVDKVRSWTRWMAQNFTTRNPEFVLSNFLRDATYANTTIRAKEPKNYAVRYNQNFTKVGKWGLDFGKRGFGFMLPLLMKYEKGTLDMNNEMEKAFKEFMQNGGETGYTHIRSVEENEKDVEKYLKMKDGKAPLTTAYKWLTEHLDYINRSVENRARFAAFLTSRQMGRTVERSVMDAKEVSVNFNKKGAGSQYMDKAGQTRLGNVVAGLTDIATATHVFFNAGVQGDKNFAGVLKHAGAKAVKYVAYLFLAGLANAAWGGGDDDKYKNLTPYERRNNICFKVPGTDMFVKIPLGVEFRTIYGLGELAGSMIRGYERMSPEEIMSEIAGLLSQVSPIDMMEGGKPKGKNLLPSLVRPEAELYDNEDFMGRRIHNKTDWNGHLPEWKRAGKHTNASLIKLSRKLNEWTQFTDEQYIADKGLININPSVVEHLVEGHFGGLATFFNKGAKVVEYLFSDEGDDMPKELELRNIPMASRVLTTADENAEARRVNNEFYKYYNEYLNTKKLVNMYSTQQDEGVIGAAEKYDFMYNSPEYGRYEIVDEYYDQVKSLTDELKETVEPEDRQRLEKEITDLKREMIEAVRNYDDARNNR